MISQAEKISFVTEAANRFGTEVTRQQLISMSAETGRRQWWLEADQYRVGRGKYALPLEELGINMAANLSVVKSEPVAKAKPQKTMTEAPAKISSVQRVTETPIVPKRDSLYVEFGFYAHMKKILGSGQFYPVFISGLSGNGKTMMVEQSCAALGREFLRVNISPETCEDDLIGGFRLVDAETKWFDGPVIQAMKTGAVLCLDEIDRGSNKLMCLQAILEGKPYLIKKTGESVVPTAGFNIVATANTKGKGDDSGRFMAATILDDAFLERFPITVEQEYPDVKVEAKILAKLFKDLGIADTEFAGLLVKWADIIRKTFQDGAIDEVISTRRLTHIAKAFQIFGDRQTAIKYCINRFDNETKTAFLDLYTKIDVQESAPDAVSSPLSREHMEEIPF
jgi:midasin (ATPase involved in ribosome maturation)